MREKMTAGNLEMLKHAPPRSSPPTPHHPQVPWTCREVSLEFFF